MNLFVKGEAPDQSGARVPYEGVVVATAIDPSATGFELLVSDISNGESIPRLRRVSSNSVYQHRVLDHDSYDNLKEVIDG
jgi:hypothetical protein